MNMLLRIQTEFTEYFLSNGIKNSAFAASYPSKNWTTLSWSYRLLSDLILGHKLHELSTLRNDFKSRVLGLIGSRIDYFSYHRDASRKIYLFKALKTRADRRLIVIPECGPCGFDILIAKLAGYDRILAYDVDPQYVECAKIIWPEPSVTISTSSSAQFDFEGLSSHADILIPDWAHDDLESRLSTLLENDTSRLVRYSAPGRFSQYSKKISQEDRRDFFSILT